MPYVNYLPGLSGGGVVEFEWHGSGPASIYGTPATSGVSVGETARHRIHAAGTVTDLWLECPDANDGLIEVTLVNLTNAFTVNPVVNATTGETGDITTGLTEAVAAGDVVVARVTNLISTTATDITIGFAQTV